MDTIIPIDSNLKVSLNIDKGYHNIPINSLFKLALRNNPKRDFIFVSKVIGKHIPINPNTLKLIGAILARKWLEECDGVFSNQIDILIQALNYSVDLACMENTNSSLDISKLDLMESALSIIKQPLKLNKRTLFIGFAETAVGIGQAVFSNFSNAYFIHTTRENIVSINSSILFKEEHSHATDHFLFPGTPNLFDEFDDIVLIDDELTTGNTALNLIKNLPEKSFGVISILDWRTQKSIDTFKDFNVRVCSLVKGSISCIKKGKLNQADPIIQLPENCSISHRDIVLRHSMLIEGYHPYTGRFGITSNDQIKLMEEIRNIGILLNKQKLEGPSLCIGTGEFIYIPCMISAELGENVYFHSTTRSPIFSRNFPNYGIANKIAFSSIDNSNLLNYLYNIPKNFYSQVFFFTEKPLSENKKENFKKIFSYFNIKEILFICWQSI